MRWNPLVLLAHQLGAAVGRSRERHSGLVVRPGETREFRFRASSRRERRSG